METSEPSTSESSESSESSEPASTEPGDIDDPSTSGGTTTTTASNASTARDTSTTAATTTTAGVTTTTVPLPLPGVENQDCVIAIQPGDSLSGIAARIEDPKVTVASLQLENGIADPDTVNGGDYLDICVGNDIDDITGEDRTAAPPPPPPPPSEVGGTGVEAQQQKLNALFADTGFPALDVDGDSGTYTQRLLCAARTAMGMSANRNSMEPGGDEERALMAATVLPVPPGAPSGSSRWALIDKTCQVMFVGEGGDRVDFVFPTSTGSAGFETRDQDGSRAFRYNAASDNGGWHNSIDYPVPEDNPLNGNMYKPLYFDDGQAIHGANNVPPEPRSKGCARLRVEHMDLLVGWLGLGEVTGQIYDAGRISLTVGVRGDY